MEVDYSSMHGERVLQTNLHSLERSASKLYTKDIFLLFRSIRRHESEWHVSFWPVNMAFKCSCMRMESIGIPCDHIVVMVHLDIVELLASLVLDRWTKNVKESMTSVSQQTSSVWDSMTVCRYKALNQISRDVNVIGCKTPKDYQETLDLLNAHYKRLKIKHGTVTNDSVNVEEEIDCYLRNPPIARNKGCGRRSSSRKKPRRGVHCSLCEVQGHNKQTCPVRRQLNAKDELTETDNDDDVDDDDYNSDNDN